MSVAEELSRKTHAYVKHSEEAQGPKKRKNVNIEPRSSRLAVRAFAEVLGLQRDRLRGHPRRLHHLAGSPGDSHPLASTSSAANCLLKIADVAAVDVELRDGRWGPEQLRGLI